MPDPDRPVDNPADLLRAIKGLKNKNLGEPQPLDATRPTDGEADATKPSDAEIASWIDKLGNQTDEDNS